MNKTNVKNGQQHANMCVLDVNGKGPYMKVKSIFFALTTICLINIFSLATEHEANCSHPKKSGAEVMMALQATDATQSEDKKLFNTLIELLSYEKIIFNGKKSIQFLNFVNSILWSFY